MAPSLVPAFLGGMLLGLGGILLWLTRGKPAGVSGLAAGLLSGGDHAPTRVAFLGGLVASGALAARLAPELTHVHLEASLPVVVAAGWLVGVGARLANGCTSGHGVCGVSRLSVRSLAATSLFTIAGAAAVGMASRIGGAP